MSSTGQRSEREPTIPPDGSRVTAMTYGSMEHDTEPEKVAGVITTHPSPFGTPQCWVNGVQVDPRTIEEEEEET